MRSLLPAIGYCGSALAFVLDCGGVRLLVSPFLWPCIHVFVPSAHTSFHMLRQGSWFVCIGWLGLLLRCYCCVTIRHQCLVVSLIIEVLPISSCVARSLWFVMICYTFFFLLSFLLRVELHKLYLVGNLQAYSSSVYLVTLWLPSTGFRNPAVGTQWGQRSFARGFY
jgi:hypothetical protein